MLIPAADLIKRVLVDPVLMLSVFVEISERYKRVSYTSNVLHTFYISVGVIF
jgi:hypothetical protein